MVGKIEGLVKVNKIQKSTLLQHRPIDVEGRVLPYLEISVDGSSYLCMVSKNGVVTGLEMIEKEDTDQNETMLKILKGVHSMQYEPFKAFDGDFILKKAREIATMMDDIDDITNHK